MVTTVRPFLANFPTAPSSLGADQRVDRYSAWAEVCPLHDFSEREAPLQRAAPQHLLTILPDGQTYLK